MTKPHTDPAAAGSGGCLSKSVTQAFSSAYRNGKAKALRGHEARRPCVPYGYRKNALVDGGYFAVDKSDLEVGIDKNFFRPYFNDARRLAEQAGDLINR